MTTMLRRTTRQGLATAMLFVWMFALVSGMANACALGKGSSLDGSPITATYRHNDAAGMHEHDDHGAAGLTAPRSSDHEDACQRFCDDEWSTLNPLSKDLGSPASMLPLLFESTTLVWTSEQALAPAAPARAVPVRGTGPPIPIRFLRLTI